MKVAQINMFPYGSTGNIMLNIARAARQHGQTARTYSTVPFDRFEKAPKKKLEDHYSWGSPFENMAHYYLGSTFGGNGLHSKHGTKKLLEDIERFSPDIIHLHNLHKFCINLPMLFDYLKRSGADVIWTLHDCWAFTGHCPYFEMVGCDKWKTSCHDCPQLDVYPRSRVDNSARMFKLKKKWFSDVPNMTIVTPSEWLAGLVKESFLGRYPIRVINNGIDLSVFRPVESDFRRRYSIPQEKAVLLGVAFGWGDRKGLDVFVDLAHRLDRDRYQLVLVGTDESVDALLPDNIISIHKTQSQRELAEIYTAADLFVNPTREDNYPTVNMESVACGTPVLTFRTGGSPEMVGEGVGAVVPCNDNDSLYSEIIRICRDKPYSREACIEYAKRFDMNEKFAEYVKLYEDSTHSTKRTV